MNAVAKKILLAAAVAAAAVAATLTIAVNDAHAYAPEQGEPLPTLAAEKALNDFAQMVRTNWTEDGEPIATVEAEVALQGFIAAAHDRYFDWNGEPIATVEAELALNELLVAAADTQPVTDSEGKPVDGVVTETPKNAPTTWNGEPVATVEAGNVLNAFVNQLNNNCQPEDAKFGCVNDPTKPIPLPGKSLWEQ